MKDQLEKDVFLEKMNTILSSIIGITDLSTVTFETNLVSGVGVNDVDLSSIDYVKFLAEIEEEYNIVFDFETVMHNISDIYNYIQDYKMKESKIADE